MTPEQYYEIFARLQAHNPKPAIELNYRNPFELLVAVILSARATDKSVNKASVELFKVANTPQNMLALGEERLQTYIQTIGLSHTKAHNLIQVSQILLEKYQGVVPNNREALESLPGVGRKTANVILNTIFGEPTIAVDTHIFRVANRTGLAQGKNVRAVEDQLLANVPGTFRQYAHHWLVLHGRYVCIARKPKCNQCVIADLCAYPEKN